MRKIGTGLLVAVLLAGGSAVAAPEAKPSEKAKKLFEAKCSTCHPLSRSLDVNKDKAGWTASVKRMRDTNGCQITDKEAKEIVEYLTKVRGPQKKK